MANRNVRGFPPEHPYTRLEIDKKAFTFNCKENDKGKVVITSYENHNARVLNEETKPSAALRRTIYRQAYMVFKKSKEIHKKRKRNKPT